jgi:hypothetical protein
LDKIIAKKMNWTHERASQVIDLLKERKLMRHENDKLGEHYLAEKSKLEEERMAE